MKYKVGDRVRIVSNDENDFKIGEIAIIDEITEEGICNYYCKNERNEEWLRKDEIMLLKYTWEDFLKAPIGTKVTFERKETLIKSKETLVQFKNTYYYRNYEELKGFEDNVGNKPLGKIIKIEEPTYTTVYEPEKIVMPEIEEMKRLTDELYKTCDEFIKKMKEKKDG